jgi:hypothetical protein
MVDLALLITFLCLRLLCQNRNRCLWVLPDKDDDNDKPIKVDENRTLTVMLEIMINGLLHGIVSYSIAGPTDISYGKRDS